MDFNSIIEQISLSSFQAQALNKVLEVYKSGQKSAILIMPAGTGKTILSVFIVEKLVEDYFVEKLAYIASSKIMQSQFNGSYENFNTKSKQHIQTFTYKELNQLILEKKISPKDFQVLLFDDINFQDSINLENIFNYFDSFKIGFSNLSLPDTFKNFIDKNGGVTFQYSLQQAINDGVPITQKNFNRKLFDNFEKKIENIEIGTDWSASIKQNLLNSFRFIESENTDYEKALELLISGEVKSSEIQELFHRKNQLNEFERLLNDESYFDSTKDNLAGAEAVWQKYFEFNPWIFGFGLNYIFNSPLEGKKLEQTVAGFSITGNGKRTDALLKTTGLIQTLCFVEIKTHLKKILKVTSAPYRSESWAISEELAGGIAQIQRTIQESLHNINTSLPTYNENGFRTSKQIYLYRPKSFLIIGSLNEFMNEKGEIHEEKFSSFELFRRSLSDIEIITFDELYARADAIVNKVWNLE